MIFIHQSEGRAGNAFHNSQASGQAAHKGCFSHTETTVKRYHFTTVQLMRQALPKRFGLRGGGAFF